jgi:hypothetical protein
MGFITPKLPAFDIHYWHWGRRSERLKAMCQHWAEHGLGIPWGVYVLYGVKIVAYVAGGFAIIVATPGIGSLDDIASWWTAPVVFEKAVIWSLLFEVLGLGCGFGPLTLRFLPPMGGALHWLRRGTLRLPPWPDKVPFTRGTQRNLVDVILYAALLLGAIWPLCSAPTKVDIGLVSTVTVLEPLHLLPLAVLVPLVGLRDKTIFLAARSEHYWIALLAFLMPYLDMVITLKVLMVLMWWAAAVSKLNRVFPFTVAAMVSNGPLSPRFMRRAMFRAFPQDLRPSSAAKFLAVLGICIEFTGPLVLLVSTNPYLTLAAVALMLVFHLHIVLSLPMGVPVEWNVFILFAIGYLYVGHYPNNLGNAAHPLLPAVLAIPVVALVTWGNLRPDQVSFLAAMRYYAGNWATSMWAFKPSAIKKIDKNVVKCSGFAKDQLRKMYGEQIAEVVVHGVLTWRSLHHHGRALFGLLSRAGGPEHEESIIVEGEAVAGALLGWNFGDGHLHNEQLIDALQELCQFDPGEVRVVLVESQPIGSDRQEYRLVDPAVGQFERGYVLVSDLTSRQPWGIDDLPAYVLRRMIAVPGDEPSEPLARPADPIAAPQPLTPPAHDPSGRTEALPNQARRSPDPDGKLADDLFA